jgi:PAS domain S-box-containing protein
MQRAWLTGFGIASRLPPEHQPPDLLETSAGTLAYMAPEQTGRMNRSIDSRSDLYSLGVTLYQMLTGALPFAASDPIEWFHCHIAVKPIPPSERLENVPTTVSAIIMKLLAKMPEERYQTAAGVEHDLRRCIAEWDALNSVAEFPLGKHDTPNRLLSFDRLFGRGPETSALLASFERVAATGAPELVLISGYAGIGKSAVVNNLKKVLGAPCVFFASGKFDQYKRDIPYAPLAEAFQGLVRPLLSAKEADLRDWRDRFRQALGPNGQLIADLVPELKRIIGEQPPADALPPRDAQRRFQHAFRRFITVFARPEHPLILFLDDLQWLDAGTLDVLEDLMTQPDIRHLIVIGAYRDNEVDLSHPLARKLETIRKAGAAVQQISLAPLTREDLGQLIGDSLHCEAAHANSLIQLVYEKTNGNPLFAIQFVTALTEEQLLIFDNSSMQWTWDLQRIRGKGYTNNVVDLVVSKLKRLAAPTQGALQLLACLGSAATDALLAAAYDGPSEQIEAELWEACRAGLVFHSEGTYRFLHDRVQEAAYSLIPEEARGLTHVHIGRLLVSRTRPAEIEERVFDIVNQLNRGADLITTSDERAQVAQLNLVAAMRARASTAYASASEYLGAGRALLSNYDWQDNFELIFQIELQMAECELFTTKMDAAERRLSMLVDRAKTIHDVASVARLRITLYTTLTRSDRAVEVCLEYLRKQGTDWSPHPSWSQVQFEYDRIWLLLGDRSIGELINLTLMTDQNALATIDLLTEIVTSASFTDENLLPLVICRMVNLSLEHGNNDASCFAYVWFGIIAGPRFGQYAVGYRFGQLGYDLVEMHGFQRSRARTYLGFGHNVMPWTKHLRTGRGLIRRAIAIADRSGDLTFAYFSRQDLIENHLATGEPLADAQRDAEHVLAFAQKSQFGLVIDIVTGRLCLIRMLRGLSDQFGSFNDVHFNEHRFQQRMADDPHSALPECWYWIRKLQAFYFAADFRAAKEASENAERLIWTSLSYLELTEYVFYTALATAAIWDSMGADEQQRHSTKLIDYSRQIEIWATNCPDNFRARSALVRAEIARIEKRDLDAIHLYEQAARFARDDGFVHHEAIANEVAGRFYLSRGLETNAYAYLSNAAACYRLWGAAGKITQLHATYPRLATLERQESEPLGQLDISSVINASQMISSEMVPAGLIKRLMTVALQNAGANRGLLLLPHKDEYRIEAAASGAGGDIVVSQGPTATQSAPESVIRYVARMHERVILDDVSKPGSFAADEYLRCGEARSLLCLPLLRQGTLAGLLYLENTLTTHAFTPGRTAVLEVLAAQAAISLENTRLYGDLVEKEARIRRLVDSNIIGIFIWDIEGQIIDANEAFLRMLGYERSDIDAGRLRWTDLTPAEYRSADESRLVALRGTGISPPYEKEYFGKYGNRIPVLIGGASFEEDGNQGVAFVLDLTERKRAEALVREGEQRYREMQSELAHANRVATIGQLSASIAHEINQPITAATTYSDAALRWLRAQPPNLDEVGKALELISASGTRAGDIIKQIRALVKKATPRRERVNINDVILEVVGLTRRELDTSKISVETQLAPILPVVRGDRVQLEQVVLNLVMNAIEAMSETRGSQRRLTVSTAQGEAGVLAAVLDTGLGLPPEGTDRLFEAFYTTKPKGLGMGLSICRSIIEAHRGRLWATNNVDRGAGFYFTLPTHG